MIPELGHLALILAFVAALAQATVPLLGTWRGSVPMMMVAARAARVQLACMLLAFAALVHAFVVTDFSVAYVAANANTQLPLMYRVSGVWGAHEGSLLLWGLMLALWTGAVDRFSRSMPLDMKARVLAVMGAVSVGFIAFMLFTSNPFLRLFPVPLEGRDLNPLLQDPGLAIHPPLLYMGYVGFSVAFAFAVAALLSGRLDSAWARWARPWTAVAWAFLTGGIALGSWWAYYELGWGGWWFWDPVENASFMPWLAGTALMHSHAAMEKRGLFRAWTLLLAILAFSLSLLGTFLVRSGVLTSVHAFATDPARGLFILIFLALVVGGSLSLYSLRAAQLRSVGDFRPLSRETLLLLNNVLLLVLTASILLGTLYPLIIDALGMGKLSVGPPWFNTLFVPLALPLAVALGLGTLARWKADDWSRLRRFLLAPAVLSLVAGFVLVGLFAPFFSVGAALGVAVALWVLSTQALALRDRLRGRGSPTRGFLGMLLAHAGVAVFAIGVSLVSAYSTEKDVRLAPGESWTLGGYRFVFEGVEPVQGPNYAAQRGRVRVYRGEQQVAELLPEKRIYAMQPNPMTEAAIDAGVSRDLFVALGEALGTDGAWSLRLYHKPFIRWIWFGALFMALGGLLAAGDPRYRRMAARTPGVAQPPLRAAAVR